jgi:hypothetical protein
MFQILLKGKALYYFEHHLRRRLEAEDSDIPDNKLIELVLRDVGLEYIPKRAIHVQKYDMRQPWGLYMGLNTSVQQFVERLNDLNRYLDQAKAWDPEWHESMVNAKIEIFEMSYDKSVSYFKHLENLEKIRRTNCPNLSSSSLPVNNKKSVTSSLGKSSKNHKGVPHVVSLL